MDKDLLQRYVEGNVSKEEVETVIKWLDADERNVHEFMALHKIYDISVLNKPVLQKNSPNREFNIPYKRIIYEALKIASILFIFYFGLQFFDKKPKHTSNTYQTLFVPAGQRAELTLPDNTKVWLNAKTKLIYPTDFGEGERIVTLDGEAYFDVAHNVKQPFRIKSGKADIQVLGTEFNVIAYSGSPSAEISLLKGSVHINTPNTSRSYIMNEHENVRIEHGEIYVSEIQNYDYFEWKEGVLYFNNETVEYIIEKLHLYFDIFIDVKRKELLNERYTGKFRTKDGVEQVIKVLQLEHQFEYTRDYELNLLTIK